MRFLYNYNCVDLTFDKSRCREHWPTLLSYKTQNFITQKQHLACKTMAQIPYSKTQETAICLRVQWGRTVQTPLG